MAAVVDENLSEDPQIEALVEANIGLALSLANRFARGDSMDDVRQAALEGLVRAAHRFDPDRGIRFSTYATACISGHLKRHFRDTTWRVHVPRRDQERFLRVRRGVDDLAARLGASPSTAQVADDLGLSVEEVLEALAVAAVASVSSTDAEPWAARDARWGGGLVDEQAAERLDAAERRITLRRMIARRLDRETAAMVTAIFFEGMSQAEVAGRMGVSQMQVSRRLRAALRRLRPFVEVGG